MLEGGGRRRGLVSLFLSLSSLMDLGIGGFIGCGGTQCRPGDRNKIPDGPYQEKKRGGGGGRERGKSASLFFLLPSFPSQ